MGKASSDAGVVRLESEKIYSGKLCIDCWNRMRANPALLVNDSYQAIGEGDCTLCKSHSKVRIPLKRRGRVMTITYKDGFALIPKRCDKCNRLFWLEPYSVYYKEVGIEHYSLKQIKCKNHGESKGGDE